MSATTQVERAHHKVLINDVKFATHSTSDAWKYGSNHRKKKNPTTILHSL